VVSVDAESVSLFLSRYCVAAAVNFYAMTRKVQLPWLIEDSFNVH
jgi:hypothetical protein